MCIAPITIKNPHFGQTSVGLSYLHNSVDRFIQVPCGNCSQCASLRQSFFNQRIQMESLRSDLFFFTLTYNNESLVYTNVGEYDIPYPYYPDIVNLIKRVRKSFPIRITYVTEYGTKRFRPHYHGIIAVERSYDPKRNPFGYLNVEKRLYDLFFSEWRRNYGTKLDPFYLPLFTPVYKNQRCTTFDLHYIEPVRDHDNDVSFYVSKYIQKYDSRTQSLLQKISLDMSLDPEEISYLSHLIKPKCVMSKDFGDYNYPAVKQYIRSCIDRLSPLPQFYDLYTGKQSLLAPYYRKHLYTPNDRHKAMLVYSDYLDDGIFLVDDNLSIVDYSQRLNDQLRKEQKHQFSKKLMEKRFSD